MTTTRTFRRTAGTALLLTLAVTAAVPAAAMAGPGTDGRGGAKGSPVGPATPVGVWRLDGYGTVLKVEAGRVKEYQVTGISCLPGESARRLPGGGFRYATEDGEVLQVRPGSVHFDGSVGDRAAHRIAALPELCRKAPGKGPVAAFDVFWQSFAENYPFFAAKGIDWNAVRDRYRPRVHPGTSDAQLFAVFREMLAPLHDAHVFLQAGDRVFAQGRPGTTMPGPELDARVKAYVQDVDLGGKKPQEFAQGRISYADLPDGRGYLRVSGFSGYTKGGGFAAESAELDRALDAVLTAERTARLRGLIVDLRINGGGYDALGLQLASRLTDRPYFAYAKRVRNDPADATRFTRPQPLSVEPAHAPRYTGPVALLTGGSTVSAGETFTQALMERPGRTVRIGQPTQGVFSDVLGRTLPNGWQIGLPNEQFLTRTGQAFDGPGIPPQRRTPVFTEEEFTQRRDSAFTAALDLL
ncbi:S41 family peptidase [Streptomyces sp. NBC_01304]|uniref:S41 family peptidase n=1 Tax=Streptomyces sp. NBC_01304 TaxID=2903818 RepID=UPI002E0D7916|nr:S41 family peptidase [Streptomyces sp. NBC_01304]